MNEIRRVRLQQIDLSDQTFSVNFLPDLRRLRASIQEVGLIQPVLLREKSTGQYQVVSGFRRVSVCRELGFAQIEARIPGRAVEDLKLFFVSLHDNLTSRGLNTVEKALVLEKLVHDFRVDPRAVIETVLPLLDLERNEKILNTFLSLARMEEGAKRFVLAQEVSRTNIRRLAAWSAEDQRLVLPMLNSLKLSENRLREMLGLVEEISKRDRCGLEKIIRLPEIQTILSRPELTPTQKAEKVKKILSGLRYPLMSRLEERFEKQKKQLNLPSGVSISPPPFFEGKGLRIAIQFPSIEAYGSILASLASLVDRKEFREMIDPRPLPCEDAAEDNAKEIPSGPSA